MSIPKLYIGTAGWSYKDWVGNFYPFKQSKEFNWLEFYSRYFNAVEVNSSYYAYLSPRVAESWLRQVEKSDDFLFTVKLHQNFTHKRKYGKEQIRAVKYILDMLKREERLGGLLIQFPYSFGFNDGAVDYLRRLIETFDEYDKFVEVRHKSWLGKKARTVTFCSIDQPEIGESIEFEPVAGNGAAYIRLHGRNAEAWRNSLKNFGRKQTYEQQNARYDYLYSPSEIIGIVKKIKELYDEVKKIFVITNNHPHGNAAANAFELMHYLNDRAKIILPETILKAYPRLKIAFNTTTL